MRDRRSGATQLVKGRLELRLDLLERRVTSRHDIKDTAAFPVRAKPIEQPIPVVALLRMDYKAAIDVKDKAPTHQRMIARSATGLGNLRRNPTRLACNEESGMLGTLRR